MSTEPRAPLTQRAYTLRLRGTDPADNSWRDCLWATHEAVNKGAKAFGDWLLTLRGGLDHQLAYAKVPPTKKQPERDPNLSEIRNRRIVLALCWLSVEDAAQAPAEFMVASGRASQSERDSAVSRKFREILCERGLREQEIKEWLQDCGASLRSAIREDAVWVSRSESFAKAAYLPKITRDHAQKVLEYFFGPMHKFLSLPTLEDGGQTVDSSPRPKEFRELARGWVSSSFSTAVGRKTDMGSIAANLNQVLNQVGKMDCQLWIGRSGKDLCRVILKTLGADPSGDIDQVLATIACRVGWRQKKSRGWFALRRIAQQRELGKQEIDKLLKTLTTEARDKQRKDALRGLPWPPSFRTYLEQVVGIRYATSRQALGEYGSMLDLAARRVSSAHSWVKRAEARRQKLDEDAAKIGALKNKHADAVKWLDDFCQKQATLTGVALSTAYRIRKRALGGKTAKAWKAVVQRWSRDDCRTEQDRIAAVHELQAGWEEDEKFGHADLFERLAHDKATCVWRTDDAGTPEVLIDYVNATAAQSERTRYKVPMYRHPDPVLHPVFCEFGESRWKIRYDIHKQPDAGSRRVKLGLLTGERIEDKSTFCWASKRLAKDLGIDYRSKNGGAKPVTRADRLGRACGRADRLVEVLNVFTEKEWNARLQVARHELEGLGRLIKKGQTDKAECARRRLPWFLTFSARLEPQGPWLEYSRRQSLYRKTKDIRINPKNERDSWQGLAYPFWHEANQKGRTGLAKHLLSRLPGLRVLSVDLGHRFAAACAVWETLSRADFERTVSGKRLLCGGTGAKDLLAHVEERGQNDTVRKVIYRRIGPDVLPDGKPHPAPWARLERQFLIKLQGEERPARAASKDEADRVKRFAERHGLVLEDDRRGGRSIEELMSRAVRMATLALRRHARRAKIAWAVDPATRCIFGMGGKETPFEVGDAAHVKLLTDALFDWHALATETKWDDRRVRDLWNDYVERVPGGFHIGEPKRDTTALDERTRQQRRKDDESLRDTLRPIAEHLAGADRAAIHAAWRKLWQGDDGCEAKDIQHVVMTDEKERKHSQSTPKVPASGWYAELRWLTDWIMGWDLCGAGSKMWTRNVGGLSLTRIATMRSLYQLHKAFAMRPRPDKPRGAPEKGETNAGIAKRILDAMERIREQRVKQLASRIAGSALGLGGHWKELNVPVRDREGKPRRSDDGSLIMKKRPVWVDEPSPKYKACHAVVIENLTNYRPDDLQTRRENRQLMEWSSSKVKKYLAEACQLHGLHLREVSPAYTSRQDSRTGMPGVRCSDVSVDEFLTSPWWRKAVNQASKKSESERTARDRYLLGLDAKWSNARKEQRAQIRLRIPTKGGEVFMSVAESANRSDRKGLAGLQADLNAAANIGLKALTDPDWAGRWWYVPCNTSDRKPAKERVGECPIILMDKPFGSGSGEAESPERAGGPKKERRGRGRQSGIRGREKEIVNLWRDPAADNLATGTWRTTKEYWQGVEERVVNHLRRSAGIEG